MKAIFNILVFGTLIFATQGAFAKTVMCSGRLVKAGKVTDIPQQTYEFDPKQGDSKDFYVDGDTRYNVEWDVSNHDGNPLISVGYITLEANVFRSAKGSAKDFVLYSEINPQNKDEVSLICLPMGPREN